MVVSQKTIDTVLANRNLDDPAWARWALEVICEDNPLVGQLILSLTRKMTGKQEIIATKEHLVQMAIIVYEVLK